MSQFSISSSTSQILANIEDDSEHAKIKKRAEIEKSAQELLKVFLPYNPSTKWASGEPLPDADADDNVATVVKNHNKESCKCPYCVEYLENRKEQKQKHFEQLLSNKEAVIRAYESARDLLEVYLKEDILKHSDAFKAHAVALTYLAEKLDKTAKHSYTREAEKTRWAKEHFQMKKVCEFILNDRADDIEFLSDNRSTFEKFKNNIYPFIKNFDPVNFAKNMRERPADTMIEFTANWNYYKLFLLVRLNRFLTSLTALLQSIDISALANHIHKVKLEQVISQLKFIADKLNSYQGKLAFAYLSWIPYGINLIIRVAIVFARVTGVGITLTPKERAMGPRKRFLLIMSDPNFWSGLANDLFWFIGGIAGFIILLHNPILGHMASLALTGITVALYGFDVGNSSAKLAAKMIGEYSSQLKKVEAQIRALKQLKPLETVPEKIKSIEALLAISEAYKQKLTQRIAIERKKHILSTAIAVIYFAGMLTTIPLFAVSPLIPVIGAAVVLVTNLLLNHFVAMWYARATQGLEIKFPETTHQSITQENHINPMQTNTENNINIRSTNDRIPIPLTFQMDGTSAQNIKAKKDSVSKLSNVNPSSSAPSAFLPFFQPNPATGNSGDHSNILNNSTSSIGSSGGSTDSPFNSTSSLESSPSSPKKSPLPKSRSFDSTSIFFDKKSQHAVTKNLSDGQLDLRAQEAMPAVGFPHP